MPKEFEKNIETIMQQLHIEPNENVWVNIDAALHEKKKRRFIFWWFFLGVGILIGAGLSFYFNNKNNNQRDISQTKTINTPTTTLNKTNSITDTIRANKRKEYIIKIDDEKIDEKPIVKPYITETTSSSIKINSQTIVVAKQENTKQNNYEQVEVKTKEDVLVINNDSDKSVQQKNITAIPKNNVTTSNNVVVDSIKDNISITKVDSIGKIDSLVVTKTETKDSSKAETKKDNTFKNKKSNWELVVGGGSLSLKENSFANFVSFGQNNGLASSGGLSNVPSTINAPTNGIHLLAGINYEKPLSKHWLFAACFRYAYLHNNQYVGKDSITTAGKHIYSSGNLQTISNYAHALKFPFQFAYVFNPSSKIKISLQAGVSFAWLFSEKWLLTDKSKSYSYADYDADNRFITSLHTGIGINNNSHYKINFKAELATSSITNSAYANQYFNSFFIEFIKPISFSIKKKK